VAWQFPVQLAAVAELRCQDAGGCAELWRGSFQSSAMAVVVIGVWFDCGMASDAANGSETAKGGKARQGSAQQGNPRFDPLLSPVLNSPYEEPQQHWTISRSNRAMAPLVQGRRESIAVLPVPGVERVTRQPWREHDVFADTTPLRHDQHTGCSRRLCLSDLRPLVEHEFGQVADSGEVSQSSIDLREEQFAGSIRLYARHRIHAQTRHS